MEHRPSNFEKKVAKLQFGYQARRQLYLHLISLLKTGMNQVDAIKMSWTVASKEGTKPKEAVAIVLNDVIQRMKNGETFGQALKPWAPQEDIMVLEAISASDKFVENLEAYLDMLEKKRKIRSIIIGGVTYPIILVSMIFAIMSYFGSSVVPKIGKILPVEQWTGPATFLRFMNNFAEHYVGPVIVTILVTTMLIVIALPRWATHGRSFADKLPVFSTYRMYTGISFLMSLASLMQGGIPTMKAIDMMRPSASRYIRHRLTIVQRHLLNGSNLGEALYRSKTGWPDTKMNLNIKIFAETQDLSAQLGTLSKDWLAQSQENIEKSMAILKTIFMILIFVVIMGIVGGIYSLQGQIAVSAQG